MDLYTEAEARSQFSKLVSRAEAGETIGITRDGKVVGLLRGISERAQPTEQQAREAARRLAALGGSEPHATAAPRRRFY